MKPIIIIIKKEKIYLYLHRYLCSSDFKFKIEQILVSKFGQLHTDQGLLQDECANWIHRTEHGQPVTIVHCHLSIDCRQWLESHSSVAYQLIREFLFKRKKIEKLAF